MKSTEFREKFFEKMNIQHTPSMSDSIKKTIQTIYKEY